MEKKKKIWTGPMLTALVRRKPEEGILDNCKKFPGEVGPLVTDNGCWEKPDKNCGACQSHAQS
jgi:hypothetical protein